MASARRIIIEFLGQDKTFGKTLKDVDDRSSKFGTTMAKVGKAAAFGLAGGLVVAGAAAVKFGQAAADDAQSADLMANAFRNNADATDKQVASTEKWITAQGRALGVADDDLRPALSRLVTATHDVGQAQKLASLAMDVSAGSGKSLEAVSTALMKAQNGQVSSLSRLGINTKDAAGATITMHEAVARMSDTFGGAASEKANTFQGKMDRLKLMMSETGEAIGYKLIPIGMKLMDWVTGSAIPGMTKLGDWLEGHIMPTLRELGDWIQAKVVPAVKNFAEQMRSGEGAGGKFADALGKMRDGLQNTWEILKPILNFMANNKTVVATFAGVILTVVAAVKAWNIAQAILDALLTANPIGLVVVGIAALAAGVVYAYKKSETFRNGVNKTWEILKKFIGFTPLGVLIAEFGALQNAVGYVVDKVKELIGWLGKIHVPKIDLPGFLNKRTAPGGNSVDLDNPGASLVASIVKGIDKGKVKLQFALDKLKAFIVKHQANLADLLDKKSQVVDALKGFTSSIFSADLSVGEGEAPAGIQRLLDFGRNARAQAEALAANVKSLIAKGLSKDLIQQLVGSGASGQEQIALLAAGTAQDIMMANEDNAATVAALQEAGVAAGGALYDAAIKQEERDVNLATMIKDQLKALLDLQDKNTVVELHLDGQTIYVTLKKLKRARGQSLDL